MVIFSGVGFCSAGVSVRSQWNSIERTCLSLPSYLVFAVRPILSGLFDRRLLHFSSKLIQENEGAEDKEEEMACA
jgi:hypothetical protein